MKRRNLIKFASALPFINISNTFATARVNFPKVVEIVVPYTPGGSNDVFARALAKKITENEKINIIVENKPGAGGSFGAVQVAQSSGNGEYLLIGSNSMVMNAVVQTKPKYHPVESFKTVSVLNRGPNLILVSKNSKYNSLAELIEGVKSGEVKTYGSAGIGSAAHLFTEMLNRELNSNIMHVPYKGITNAIIDMMGENIDLVIATPASASGQIKAGLIKALGVTSAGNSDFFPDLEPVTNYLPNYIADSWWGIFASNKTSPELLSELHRIFDTASKDQEMIEMFKREATIPTYMGQKEAENFVAEETETWGKVAKSRNITSDN